MTVLQGVALLAQQSTLRSWGIEIGIFPTGAKNAIVDVPGVKVGHETIIEGDNIRTGVTAILPHSGNLFQEKIPGAIYVANGFGKLAGTTQVEELGNIESPIILTNTLAVSTGIEASIRYTLGQNSNEGVRSVNSIVGETNDGRLNDIRSLPIKVHHVLRAIETADASNTQEGNVGAGTGTMSFGFKGGIGTSSRKLPESLGGYTIGVLVQTNFGGVLEIAGVPVGKELKQFPFQNHLLNPDGSCMIVILTDAPILARNLKRVARRAMLGFGKTGGMSSNGSGDYVIAGSTAKEVRYAYQSTKPKLVIQELRNDQLSSVFQATIEATEEAILNALMAAEDMEGFQGFKAKSLDHEVVKSILKKYRRTP